MNENQNSYNGIGFFDILTLMSFMISIQNLAENEQQSKHLEDLISQIDVDASNDKQADRLINNISVRLDKQDRDNQEIKMELKEIKEILKKREY